MLFLPADAQEKGRIEVIFTNVRSKAQSFVANVAIPRTYIAIAVVALVVSAFFVATPAHATFSLSMTDMLDSAADIFNGLWPAFAIVVGLGLGVQILNFIVKAVRSAF